MGGDELVRDIDGDPKTVVAAHESARDQGRQFHAADYTPGTGDDKP
jgi:hypothetical protein